MTRLSIEGSIPKAYTIVHDALSVLLSDNQIASWQYSKPVFHINHVEGVNVDDLLFSLADSVDGFIEIDDDTEDEMLESEVFEMLESEVVEPTIVESSVVESDVVEPTVVEPAVVEMTVEPELVLVRSARPVRPPPKMYEARIFTAYPGTHKDAALEEVVESKERPWCMMVYKKYNHPAKGKYPTFVSYVEVWYEGECLERFPPISKM
jgi:hypothetical protein